MQGGKHSRCGEGVGNGGGDGRSGHPHPQPEHQERVSGNIQQIPAHGYRHGQAGVPRRPINCGGTVEYSQEGIGESGDQEVGLGGFHHRFFHRPENQPEQGLPQHQAEEHHQQGKESGAQKHLAGGPVRAFPVLMPQVLGADDRSAGGHGRKKEDHQLVQGVHQGDAGHGGGADVGYHHGVHDAHQTGEYLLDDQRDQQLPQVPVGKHEIVHGTEPAGEVPPPVFLDSIRIVTRKASGTGSCRRTGASFRRSNRCRSRSWG